MSVRPSKGSDAFLFPGADKKSRAAQPVLPLSHLPPIPPLSFDALQAVDGHFLARFLR
jgi:hypothetical protein